MNYFQCCVQCVAPKRHKGCHSSCEEYLKDKKAYEARKVLIEEDKKKYPKYKIRHNEVNPWRKF